MKVSAMNAIARFDNMVEPADKKAFAAAFPNKPFALNHQLAGNPLFSLDRIVDLDAVEVRRFISRRRNALRLNAAALGVRVVLV